MGNGQAVSRERLPIRRCRPGHRLVGMPRFLAALAVVLLVAGCADSEPRTLAPGPHSGPPEASRQPVSPELTGKLAAARAASARFVTDLAAAEKAG